jgi:hypothetical protein
VFYQKKSHSSSTCSEHRGHEQTSAAITPLVLSKLDFLQARQRKMGKRKNWASSQQNTYHLPQAPTAASNLIYLHQSHILPSFISHQNSPMIFHQPLISAHLLYPQNSTTRLKCISSSKFPPKNTSYPSLPCPTQPSPAPLIHHTLIILPPTNQKKSHQILARTHPTLSQNIPITFPTPPPKKEIISITSTPTPTPTLHYIIAYSKINPPPLPLLHTQTKYPQFQSLI